MILERLDCPDLLEEEMKMLNNWQKLQKGSSLDRNSTSQTARQTTSVSASVDTNAADVSRVTSIQAKLSNVQTVHQNQNKPNRGVIDQSEVTEVVNDDLHVSNVSLTDILNSSNESANDFAGTAVDEFPRIGLSCGSFSQSQRSVHLQSFNVLPANASTPLRKADTSNGLEGKGAAQSNDKEDEDSVKKTVIRQTIESRLTQVQTRDVAKAHVDVTEEKPKSDEGPGLKLVCVKDKKSKKIGESSKMSAKVKKTMKNMFDSCKKSTASSEMIVDDGTPFNGKETRVKKRKKEMAILSDSEEELENVNDNKRKKDDGCSKLSKTEATVNQHESGRKSSDVSLSTLSKLKQFQFNESKSSLFNSSTNSDGSFTESILSGALWTETDKQTLSALENKDENAENINRCANSKNNKRTDLETECDKGVKQTKMDSSQSAKLKQFSFKKVEEKSTDNKSNETPVESEDLSKAGGKILSLQPANKSPAWLSSINKKFSPRVSGLTVDTASCLDKTLGESQEQTGTTRVNTLTDTGGIKAAGKSNTGPSTAGSSIFTVSDELDIDFDGF